jgi:carbohydrate-selective porin OprB
MEPPPLAFCNSPAAGFDYHTEVAVEAYYKISIKSWIALQPDPQYIRHSGGLRSQSDAVVATPRLVISFRGEYCFELSAEGCSY